jgi:hypothetical protein
MTYSEGESVKDRAKPSCGSLAVLLQVVCFIIHVEVLAFLAIAQGNLQQGLSISKAPRILPTSGL